MTWLKLDDSFPDHPKVKLLGDRARRWFIDGLCYASRFLTDGLLPPAFRKTVPDGAESELVAAGLWEFDGPDLKIHDYLHYQSSRDDVVRRKAARAASVMRYRVRQRNALQARDSNALVTDPDTEIREQIQRTDTETTPPASGAAAVPGMGLTVNRAKRERVRTSYAYDGTYLRVPSVLHEELCRKSGPNSAALLHEFYAEEDEKLEREGKGTGDIFDFLRPRHQEWAIRKGVVEAAPTPMKRPKVAERAESRPPVTDRERAHAAEVRAQNEAQDAEQAQAIEAEYWRTHPAYAPKS